MSEPKPWHRLFGTSLVDLFRGLPITVEMEKDLSLKQQLLDVVLIRKGPEPLPRRLPDGFDELAAHNLISFKSYQQALDGWALLELLAHYVNYRKQVSPSMQELLPESDFRLFAVTVRYPQGLSREVPLLPVQPGVYDVRHFTGTIRVIVVHELPQEEHNALLHLFSARPDLVRYGAKHYRIRSNESSTLLMQLFARYQQEATLMPDMLQQLAEETLGEIFQKASADDLLRRVKPETIDELLKKLPDDLLASLSPETRATLARRLRDEGTPPNPEGGKPEKGQNQP
jgi:hypothetical protein